MNVGQLVNLYLFGSLFGFYALFLLFDFNVLNVGPITSWYGFNFIYVNFETIFFLSFWIWDL